MRYLNNFNESKEEDIDYEYVDICFVDFIDEERYNKQIYRDGSMIIDITIPDEYTRLGSMNNIDSLLKINKWKENDYLKVKDSLNKIKLQMPFLYYYINFNDHENMDENSGLMTIRLQKDPRWAHKI
jgi:hypothetical protein